MKIRFFLSVWVLGLSCHSSHGLGVKMPTTVAQYCRLAEAIFAVRECRGPVCSGATLAEDECVSRFSTKEHGIPFRLLEYSLNAKGEFGDPLVSPGTVCSKNLFVPLLPSDGGDEHMMIIVMRDDDGRLMYRASPAVHIYESGSLGATAGTACGGYSSGFVERLGSDWVVRPAPVRPFW